MANEGKSAADACGDERRKTKSAASAAAAVLQAQLDLLPYYWTENDCDNVTAAMRSVKLCPYVGGHAPNMLKQTGHAQSQ